MFRRTVARTRLIDASESDDDGDIDRNRDRAGNDGLARLLAGANASMVEGARERVASGGLRTRILDRIGRY